MAMKFALQVLCIGGPLALATMTAGGHAAPIAGAAADLRAAAAETSPMATVASRHCWRRHGKLHCTGGEGQRHAYRYKGDSDYYEHDSSRLPFGTQRWWDQMLRENRLNSGGGRD
jgi:hypothetical protein